MIRSPRRSAGRSRVALAVLATAGGVLLAGCAAGQQAQTARQFPTVDGANAEIGSIALRNIAIEYPDGGVYRRGSVARLRMVLVNNGTAADTLVEVRTGAAGEVAFAAGAEAGSAGESSPSGTPGEGASVSATPSESASPSGSGTTTATSSATPSPTPSATDASAPAPTSIQIPPNGRVGIGEGDTGTAILLRGLTQELRSAQIVPITFVFRTGGAVTVQVPVSTPEGDVEPAPTIPTGEDEAAE